MTIRPGDILFRWMVFAQPWVRELIVANRPGEYQ